MNGTADKALERAWDLEDKSFPFFGKLHSTGTEKPSDRRKQRKVIKGNKIKDNKTYALSAAVEILQKMPKSKFNQTVDLAFHLGTDPTEKYQIVHVPVGKVNFEPAQIAANARAVIQKIVELRPYDAEKGDFVQDITISATESPPMRLNVREFLNARKKRRTPEKVRALTTR